MRQNGTFVTICKILLIKNNIFIFCRSVESNHKKDTEGNDVNVEDRWFKFEICKLVYLPKWYIQVTVKFNDLNSFTLTMHLVF